MNSGGYNNHTPGYNNGGAGRDAFYRREGYNARMNEAYASYDPYSKHDVYDKRDPYDKNDPYARRDPWDNLGYGTNEQKERNPGWLFWFWIKRQVQMLFNAEAGAGDLNFVYPVEEDLTRFKIYGEFFKHSIISLFIISSSIVISFFLSSLKMLSPHIILLINFFIPIVYGFFLFLPTFEILTSGEFAIYRNVKDFFSRIKNMFKSYLISSFIGILIGLSIVSLFYLYYYFYKKVPFSFMNKYVTFHSISVGFFVTVLNVVIFTIIFFIYKKALLAKVVKRREENIKRNIVYRQQSHFEQKASFLDEE